MKEFEILPQADGVSVRVRASTRAGLVAAAVQGMFAAAKPRTTELDEKVERPFSMEAADFGRLLVDVLNEAVRAAAADREAYDDIRFTLITDKKAEGAFIGRPCAGFGTEIKAASHRDLKVEKNEKGQWETTISFDV